MENLCRAALYFKVKSDAAAVSKERQVEDLTQCLFHFVEPLLQHSNVVEQWNEARKSLLKKILVSSIDLKTDLLFRNQCIELYMPRGNTYFNSEFMETEPDAVVTSDSRVCMCLRPAVLAYAARPLKASVSSGNQRVGVSEFIDKDDNSRRDVEVISKAFVQLYQVDEEEKLKKKVTESKG